MNFAKPYEDLREFISALDGHEKLYRISKEINKDSELQPLVRWQYRGGIAEEARRGFLFDNVVDGKKHKYNCRVLVGGLSGSSAIYCLGLKCEPEEVPDRWIYALDHLIAP
jgi:4-hydroxy-3-polyprenylbenzoate decarboxylase